MKAVTAAPPPLCIWISLYTSALQALTNASGPPLRSLPHIVVLVRQDPQETRLFLESTDATKDIQIYINSPGGSVYAGLGIYDTMQLIKPDVATICTGMAASMGAVLLCAGAKGKRSGLTHSRVMIHQPLGGAQGQASDIEITAREILILKEELYKIISKHSGQEYDKVYADSDRDYWMKSDKALEYGMIDEILSRS